MYYLVPVVVGELLKVVVEVLVVLQIYQPYPLQEELL
jgi:hypothetical protein